MILTAHLAEKGKGSKNKGSEILHINISPAASYTATKHASKVVKIWSIPRNTLHGTIKTTSYVQPQVRSREYFVRSHAILSEMATLICITTHFGLTIEVYNFSKGGSSAKKVQVIEDAHRWAVSQLDALHTDYAPLAVYRPKGDRIDCFFLSRHPNAKQPLREDPSHSIELLKADLPIVPQFPELAYSSDSPVLLAAAGPRPGDPPRPHATILVAWVLKPVSEAHLYSKGPEEWNTSIPDETRHKPWRVCVPEYPALQTALPTCLVSHGNTAVSIWIPAANTDLPLLSRTSSHSSSATSPTKTKPPALLLRAPPPATPHRFVLVWDLPSNSTHIFAIPNVHACVSPDCRRVAYCDAVAGQFVVVDVASATEVWRWPPEHHDGDNDSDGARRRSGQQRQQQQRSASSLGLLDDLQAVTVFEFSADSRLLVVGDASGAVGVFEIREGAPRFELGDGSEVALADVMGPNGGLSRSGAVAWRGGGGSSSGSGSGSGGVFGIGRRKVKVSELPS